MPVASNILKLLNLRQLRPADLARLAKLPPTTISKYIKRNSVPSVEKAYAIARALGVPLEALVTGRLDETVTTFEPVPLLAQVPDEPLAQAVEFKLGTVTVPLNLLPDREGACFALKVRDESMLMAGLVPGSVVIVRYQAALKKGDIAAAVWEGEGYLRYILSHRRTIVLQSASPAYPPTIVPQADADALKLVGKVVLAISQFPPAL